MAIQPGTRLGPYEVVSAIGAGGMGEVYRAHDTRLNRDVALKVLPEAFARDTQRMARFEREAKLLASLNHPNIAAIYGLEESGPIRALVMELVEGPTLAERIRSGADSAGRSTADCPASGRRGRVRARQERHSPRSEARQHQGDRRGHGEGAGFRPGEGDVGRIAAEAT